MVHRSRPNSPARTAAVMVPAETCCGLPLLLVLLYDSVDVADADSVVDEGPVVIEVAEYMFINARPPQTSLLLPVQAEVQPVGFGRPGFGPMVLPQ